MKGSEIVKELRDNKVDQQNFIKWWRRENDFLDYELVAKFLEDVEPNQEFGGYEVLGLEEMWRHLQKIAPERVKREKRGNREVVVWTREAEDGTESTQVCDLTPRNLMAVFDVETRGNVVDS